MTEETEDESVVKLRRCDLNSVLCVLSLGNKGAVDASWNTIKLFEKNVKGCRKNGWHKN